MKIYNHKRKEVEVSDQSVIDMIDELRSQNAEMFKENTILKAKVRYINEMMDRLRPNAGDKAEVISEIIAYNTSFRNL